MVCLRSYYAMLGIAGYAAPDGGLRAMGRSRGGAARRNAGRYCRPQAQPGLRAAGRGGSYISKLLGEYQMSIMSISLILI